MTQPNDALEADGAPWPCNLIVLRLARKTDKVIDPDTGEFLPPAFYRRENLDGSVEDEPSVFRRDRCSPRYAATMVLKKCHGVASLHVGHVRTINVDGRSLDVVTREEEKYPRMHGGVTGVANYYNEEERELAERQAELLADQSRKVWRRGESDPNQLPDDTW